jgi:hypothetical protein
MKLVVFFLFLSTSLLCQTPKKYKCSFGVHYLSTIDYSIQKPDGESSFKCLTPAGAGYRSFEIQFALPFTNLFQVETGYRFKQHPIAYKNKYLLSSQWVETTHSIPLRIGISSKFKRRRFLSRFSVGFSCGALVDIMQQSEGRPLVSTQQFQINTPAGAYIIKDDYKPNEVNQVKAAISFDGYMQISYQVFNGINIYFGYGYTQGTRTLAKGYYTIKEPNSVTTKGSMMTNGTYRYAMLGFCFLFRNKSNVR